MSSNKKVKDKLQSVYGKGCMFKKGKIEEQIDELNKKRKRKIVTYKRFLKNKKFTLSKIVETEKIISVHHLKHRSEGGATTPENCALVNRLAHDYLHSLPREDEEEINDFLRTYKDSFSINIAEVSTEGVKQVKRIDQKTQENDDFLTIRAYDNEPDYYAQLKKERNIRTYKKFNVDYPNREQLTKECKDERE